MKTDEINLDEFKKQLKFRFKYLMFKLYRHTNFMKLFRYYNIETKYKNFMSFFNRKWRKTLNMDLYELYIKLEKLYSIEYDISFNMIKDIEKFVNKKKGDFKKWLMNTKLRRKMIKKSSMTLKKD